MVQEGENINSSAEETTSKGLPKSCKGHGQAHMWVTLINTIE